MYAASPRSKHQIFSWFMRSIILLGSLALFMIVSTPLNISLHDCAKFGCGSGIVGAFRLDVAIAAAIWIIGIYALYVRQYQIIVNVGVIILFILMCIVLLIVVSAIALMTDNIINKYLVVAYLLEAGLILTSSIFARSIIATAVIAGRMARIAIAINIGLIGLTIATMVAYLILPGFSLRITRLLISW